MLESIGLGSAVFGSCAMKWSRFERPFILVDVPGTRESMRMIRFTDRF